MEIIWLLNYFGFNCTRFHDFGVERPIIAVTILERFHHKFVPKRIGNTVRIENNL
ncbi:hypothetical protein D3C87_1486910 [compost metagenome]